MNNKGFIQIPLLIIIIASIVTVSASIGFVLHKQDKLASDVPNVPNTANISEAVIQNKESASAKDERVEVQELKSEQEIKTEVVPKEEKVVQQEIDKINKNEITEQKQELSETAKPELEIEPAEEEAPTQELISEKAAEKPIVETPTKEFICEPSIEICDGVDNDCDGQIDEGNVCEIPETETDPCVDVNCPVCQYCSNSACVARPNGYNDCGSGCQKCMSGFCQDCNDICPDCQYCSSDICVNYCQGKDSNCGCANCVNCDTNDGCVGDDYHDYFCDGVSCKINITHDSENCITCNSCQHYLNSNCQNYCEGTDINCGCISCTNCNDLDRCSENNYLDYSCSDNSCISNSDDCSDCSCSCGGYNIAESIENQNCDDGKDNDCDGTIDSVDFGCESFQLNEQDIEYSVIPKEIQSSIRTNFVCHFKILKPNFDYSRIKALYFKFYNEEDDGHFSFSAGIGSLHWENNQGEFTFSIVVSHNNNPRIWRLLSIDYEIKYSNMYSIPISNGIELIR